MCEHHSTDHVAVIVPAHLSHTGQARPAIKGIDRCIAPVVAALNAGGVATVASCCGHGSANGSIVLADGRELRIYPTIEGMQPLARVHEGCTHTTDTLRQAAWQFNEAVSLLREAREHVAPATSLLAEIDEGLPAIQAACEALASLLAAEGPDHE